MRNPTEKIDNCFFPYGRQYIDRADIDAVLSVLKSDYLTCGSAVEHFEEMLCSVTDAEYAIACNSGTSALHLAMIAADIQVGDYVIVPAITFVASANAVRMQGANVIFADVDPETGLVELAQLQDAIAYAKAKKLPIKAMVQVHLNGQCTDLKATYELAKEHGIIVIDDACHALGSVYLEGSAAKKSPIGSNAWCDFTTFSFHPVKTIAMGEGGAVTTNDATTAEHLKRLRSHGLVRGASQDYTNANMAYDSQGLCNSWYYEATELGYNYRASDIHCALGASQLNKLNNFAKKRRTLLKTYQECFEGMSVAELQLIKMHEHCEAVWHLCPSKIDFSSIRIDKNKVMQRLRERGVGTQVHYIPVAMQPYYQSKDYCEVVNLDGAVDYYNSELSLPLYVTLEEADVIYIAQQLKEIFESELK